MEVTHQGQVPRVFVSHSHVDNAFGLRLVNDLRQALGFEESVWYDVAGGLNGGDHWWNKIIAELTSRPVFIVVLSPDALRSLWVNDEINVAWQQKNSAVGKRIIPVLLHPCTLRQDLETLQIISFVPPVKYEEAFARLLRAVGVPHSGVPVAPAIPAIAYGGGSDSQSQGHTRIPSGTPTSTVQPQQFEGSGPQVSPKLTLQKGLTIFRMTHEGKRNFSVWLLNDEGDRVDLLAHSIGAFEGAKAVGLQQSGTYLLNIHADGQWTVVVESG